MEKGLLLGKLPPFLHRYTTVKKNQSVYDIVKEVLEAHEIFASDYDRIANDFNFGSNREITKRLFNFLKSNVRYVVEGEDEQTTKSPSALLTQGYGDCKHYAGFIAGVLDALNRQGRNIDWHYRFASYDFFNNTPGHVFVVMNDNGEEIWIDPVLKTFNEKLQPFYILDKKPKQMLQRLSGIYDEAIYLDESDKELSPELIQAIALLLDYMVLNAEGRINDDYLVQLSKTIPPEEFKKLADARALLHDKAISGLFSSLWSAVKTVTLAIPRTAYLQLVLLNFRNQAADMAKIIFKGTTLQQTNTPEMNELKTKWEKLGGKWTNLVTYVAAGRLRKATIGAAQVAAWAVTAAAIIAAMTPIINALISKINANGGTAYPGGTFPNNGYTTGNGITDFIQNNPLVLPVALVAGYYMLKPKNKKNVL